MTDSSKPNWTTTPTLDEYRRSMSFHNEAVTPESIIAKHGAEPVLNNMSPEERAVWYEHTNRGKAVASSGINPIAATPLPPREGKAPDMMLMSREERYLFLLEENRKGRQRGGNM